MKQNRENGSLSETDHHCLVIGKTDATDLLIRKELHLWHVNGVEGCPEELHVMLHVGDCPRFRFDVYTHEEVGQF